MSGLKAIGGVMAAAETGASGASNLLDAWSAGWRHFSAFASARSALAAVLEARGAERVWLPAYICVSAFEGAAASGAEIRFYPCDRTLKADLDAVAHDLRSGDAVVGVEYFGRSAGDDFLELRNRRPELLWIEDRAQALDTGRPAWGDVLIYSPRKLVGVGDGGLIFSQDELPRPAVEGSHALWAPEDARALDPDGANPPGWRPLFQAREASLKVDQMGVSARTLEALGRLSAISIAKARRENWRVLAAALGEFALWGDLDPEFAPLAFPIVVEDVGNVVAALAELRIWTPRHWAELPSDPDEFPEAAWLSARCLSLPLDQRYDAADMERVAGAVRSVARPGVHPR
jgi:dTDP-4-amino-4,6-dideoxygalactose transaminase